MDNQPKDDASNHSREPLAPIPNVSTPNQVPTLQENNVDKAHIPNVNDFFDTEVNEQTHSNTPFGALTAVLENNPDKRRFKLVAICIAAIVIILGLFILGASLRSAKLTNYSFTNSGDKYSLLFYRNATLQNHRLGSSVVSVLTSQSDEQYDVPVQMILGVTLDQSGSANYPSTSKSNDCEETFGGTEAFNIFIPSLRANINFCSFLGVDYFSYFSLNSTHYFMQIQKQLPRQFSSIQTILNTKYGSAYVSNKLSVIDVKKIASSFKLISRT